MDIEQRLESIARRKDAEAASSADRARERAATNRAESELWAEIAREASKKLAESRVPARPKRVLAYSKAVPKKLNSRVYFASQYKRYKVMAFWVLKTPPFSPTLFLARNGKGWTHESVMQRGAPVFVEYGDSSPVELIRQVDSGRVWVCSRESVPLGASLVGQRLLATYSNRQGSTSYDVADLVAEAVFNLLKPRR